LVCFTGDKSIGDLIVQQYLLMGILKRIL